MQEQIMKRFAEMTPDRAEEIGRQLDAMQAEEEAWKLAQLAAMLCGGVVAIGKQPNIGFAVAYAKDILAESRRQAAASPAEAQEHQP